MNEDQDIGAVQRSQEFFRLKQELQSSGDIFELNESARAIYIGPDSDVGEVQVTYFNPDEPDAVETAIVSVNGPLVGRVDSLPVTTVPSTGQGGRILVNVADLVVTNYNPGAVLLSDLAAQRNFNAPIVLDLMVALKTLPSIPEVRADRTIRYSGVPFQISPSDIETDGSTNLLVPIYGRRMITVAGTCHVDETIVSGVTISLAMIRFAPGIGNPLPMWLGSEQAAAAFLVPAQDNGRSEPRAVVIRASDAARSGATYSAAGALNGMYQECDQIPALLDANVNPGRLGARGMADLLLINIRAEEQPGPPAEQVGFCDIFLKLADRET